MTPLFRRILVPYDFSTAATKALEIAIELASGARGRIVVLHAIAEFTPVAAFPAAGEMVWIPPDNLEKNVRQQLETAVAKSVGRRHVPVDCRVEIGDPFQRIIDAARGAESIVMGTVGRTGLTHLLIGSVAEKVVRHSPVPVLTIRPDAAERMRRRTARAHRGSTPRAGRSSSRRAPARRRSPRRSS